MYPEQRKLAIAYMGHEVLRDCAITISHGYSNLWVNPLPRICSVMIWVTTFLVCLEVMMHYTKRPDTKSDFIPIPPPPPTMFNVFAVMEISFTDIGLSSLPHNATTCQTCSLCLRLPPNILSEQD